jgi:uncharacterized protein (DUF302 family)
MRLTMNYGYTKRVELSFDKTLTKIREELQKEGFGVLSEINVQATLKNKLNADFIPYVILGACNPPLAHKALQVETEIGLLLPCNVIVYKKEENVFVSAIKPSVAMSMINNEELQVIAQGVEKKLKRVIDATVEVLS